ncbi:PREDICTED: uncharacterized protein LOC107193756 [Dufourea novaeangliae]|uniref:uncharacterized protein LOC107193756 n=1 Tax=Dufourea novaeangliae TaxID=178035 RepID=UPI0007671FEB|nr:PREDICTED: uncharacterized protein LOC107193756 [Dufourea novaeangliae]
MEAVKRQRRANRMSFTKVHNAFAATMQEDTSTREEKIVAFQLLEAKMTELNEAHVAFNNALFQSDLDDEAIAKELETDDVYKTNFLKAKLNMADLLGTSEPHHRVPAGAEKKIMKLPRIELPKFNGSVKEWLPFWSQFKKIHDDQTIGRGDKFQYLLQAIVAGSRASELLLGHVLQNAVKGNKRPSLASLYDKLESYIRALETLGVATDKCAAMLYPLVESSLPEEVLRAWQRNGQREAANANEEGETKDRLTRMLTFLQCEVENEERIDMALQSFQISTEGEGCRRPENKPESTKEPC